MPGNANSGARPGHPGMPGAGRPRQPAATLARIVALQASLNARPAQLAGWSEAALLAVVRAASALAGPFQDELDRRWHKAGLADD